MVKRNSVRAVQTLDMYLWVYTQVARNETAYQLAKTGTCQNSYILNCQLDKYDNHVEVQSYAD